MKIAIFKAGKHTDTHGTELNADNTMLDDVMSSYDAKSHEAPAVIGHPRDNHPAYGWVKALSVENGTLFADFDQVAPEFAQMLTDGRFKKRSASFYQPDHPQNPTPGKWYLRHVGFLGAQPPAVKGLPDFADEADCPIFEFSDFHQPNLNREDNTMSKTTEAAKAIKADEATSDFAEREAKIAADEAAIKAREDKLKADEAAFAQKQEAERKKHCSDFAESLIDAAKILPAEKNALVAVLLDVDSTATADFAENGKVVTKPRIDVLKMVLNRLPNLIEFAELTGGDPNAAAKPQHERDESAQADAELDKQIQDFADKNNCSYAAAAQQFEMEA